MMYLCRQQHLVNGVILGLISQAASHLALAAQQIIIEAVIIIMHIGMTLAAIGEVYIRTAEVVIATLMGVGIVVMAAQEKETEHAITEAVLAVHVTQMHILTRRQNLAEAG